MSAPTQVWISEHAHRRLREELRDLRGLLTRAADQDADDENLVAITRARQRRVQQIHDLLLYAVVGEDPPDDGIAEPGMVLTVRYDDTGDREIFLLGVRGTEHDDVEIYSSQSPLGQAILGARVGQRRTYRTPAGASVGVTLLAAVPYGMHHAHDATVARLGTD